jgi:tRNA A-37 threonylcarbamoyl transferase component Bud32
MKRVKIEFEIKVPDNYDISGLCTLLKDCMSSYVERRADPTAYVETVYSGFNERFRKRKAVQVLRRVRMVRDFKRWGLMNFKATEEGC